MTNDISKKRIYEFSVDHVLTGNEQIAIENPVDSKTHYCTVNDILNLLPNAVNDPGWETPTLLNQWTNLDGTATCQYRKHGKQVEVKGIAKPPAGLSGTQSIILNLPPGYRPLQNRGFPSVGADSQQYRAYLLAVASNGDLSVGYSAGNAPTTLLTIEVTFFAEN